EHLDARVPAVEPRNTRGLERFALAPVRVALDADADEPERELPRALDLARQDDEPRARPEERFAGAVELLDRGDEVPRLDELEQGRGLAPRDDQSLDGVELGGLAHLRRLDAALLQRLRVQPEVALEGENADPHPTSLGSGA